MKTVFEGKALRGLFKLHAQNLSLISTFRLQDLIMLSAVINTEDYCRCLLVLFAYKRRAAFGKVILVVMCLLKVTIPVHRPLFLAV